MTEGDNEESLMTVSRHGCTQHPKETKTGQTTNIMKFGQSQKCG